ncbi:MAG: GNAT family N-acetyltransferase [Acetatifactor sp.]|nr:GNAT family N-acetyltransferase [Acetatifactor sp.]
MTYRKMEETDIESLVLLYMNYYNEKEDGQWTAQTTYKRIHQVFTREDSYCLILEDNCRIIAFAIGFFEQYDDGFAYDLVEIVVDAEYQKKGIGKAFMRELENRVKAEGAMLVQLEMVNDEHHEHFYGSLGYKNAVNLVLKTKLL